jgi:uncharacterized membrane protein YdjX (TVP38/TMEM64 family)
MIFLNQWMAIFERWTNEHAWLAPLLVFFLPFLEAILPSLPLTLIVGFSLGMLSILYGATWGIVLTIVLSTLGSFFGMFLIFLLIRKIIKPAIASRPMKHPIGIRFIKIVNEQNNLVLFSFLANPFFPSSILNYILSSSAMKPGRYIALTFLSRWFVIVSLVFLGSIFNVQEHPWNILWMSLFYSGILILIHFRHKEKSV